jgi:O-antigen ligase
VATLVSIAASQILLGVAFIAAIAAYGRVELPPVRLPLALFVAGTLVSLALSAEPAAGMPQVRKLYALLALGVIATSIRSFAQARTVLLWCSAAGAASALWSFVEFWRRMDAAERMGLPFYTFYVGDRISGFMSHWMTFGGQMSIVLTLLVAILLFDPPARFRWAWWGAVMVMGTGLVLAFTRGMWFAAAAGGIYLVARWRRKLLLALPVAAVVAFAVAPGVVRQRVSSIYQPQGTVDSNLHRVVTWRTGVEMIKAHPWFGVGPEHVGREFRRYVPSDVAPKLPEGWYGHLHNIYLQYAAERGIPVLAAVLWLIGAVLWRAVERAGRGEAAERAVLHGVAAAIIAVLVGGFFEFNLGDSEVLMLFLSLLAMAYVREPERA